ncbi:MAG: tryptophan synthase subunit alpha [bacterium]
MRRIEETFARLKRKGRGALIPFVTAGDPNLDVTRELIVELARAGASVIELGVPFSDPMADGPVIQRSSERALRNRVGLEDILQTVSQARESTHVPIVLFSYYNPLLQFGLERLSGEAAEAGVNGVLVTDLAPEEAEDFQNALAAEQLDMIYLVAPTSTDDRLRMIAGRATGFIYAVSRTGVTGTRKESADAAATLVARVRAVTNLPVAVGFGVSNRTQVEAVLRYADAAVVGSAIVAEIENEAGNPDLVKHVGVFVQSLMMCDGAEAARLSPSKDMEEKEKTTNKQNDLLRDHADGRMVTAQANEIATDRNQIVQLDPDHPGFRDPSYRARRNEIARLAMEYQAGEQIPNVPYDAKEHQLWQSILQIIEPQHRWHACKEYLECIARLDLPRDRVPQLSEVSAKVERVSGFRLEPVAGLVQPRVFLESLANGVFLCTQYIRHHSTPLYTPEPDVVHELLGHAVTLASEPLAELNRMVGRAVRGTTSSEALERLSRVYWYTLEFGVLIEQREVKAYGTGLLSSAGELEDMHRAELRPLDLQQASRLEYDPTRFQPVLFCANSFESMHQGLMDYLISFQ